MGDYAECEIEEGFDVIDVLDKEFFFLQYARGAVHTEDLPIKLTLGQNILITGKLEPTCYSFAVNLLCDKDKIKDNSNSDIAFHFNPRVLQRYVVRNSRIKGKWGAEETTCYQYIDLKGLTQLKVNILTGQNHFYVTIDDKFICSFKYRLPTALINRIEIIGAVNINGITFDKVTEFPPFDMINYTVLPGIADLNEYDEESLLQLPIRAYLPEGLAQDWQLEISGRVKILPIFFTIFLQDAARLWPKPNIALKMRCEYINQGAETLITCNTHVDTWGNEERSTVSQHFIPYSLFILKIKRIANHYVITSNDRIITEFKFRGNVNNVDTFIIEGDLFVSQIHMNKLR